jgi:hypothetical protein
MYTLELLLVLALATGFELVNTHDLERDVVHLDPLIDGVFAL